MKSGRIVIFLTWLSIFTTAFGSMPTVERSVSPSGEFVIYGSDARSRGAISTAAEATKSSLLSLLRRRDSWSTPIVINLQSPAANLPELPCSALRISQTESGLKLQLDLAIGRGVDSAGIERELLRAVLLEMIYRKQTSIAAGQSYVEPPAWLIEGLVTSLPNRDRTPLVSALDAIGKVVSVEEFLRQKFELIDSTTQILYRAYSFALVQWLIENDESRARFGRYIDNLASASNDPVADLQAAFPELAGKNLERDWQSRIVAFKRSSDLQTFSGTEKELADLLQTKFPSAPGRNNPVSLAALCSQQADRQQQRALKKFSDALVLLSARANPVLRPVVQEYQQLAARLALQKNHGVAARLAQLEKLRRQLSARMTEVDDYMNWFEATQLNTSSGLFENSSTAPGDLKRSTPHRKDALSIYLDVVEQQN